MIFPYLPMMFPHFFQLRHAPRQLRGQREHRINELREELDQERQEASAQVEGFC